MPLSIVLDEGRNVLDDVVVVGYASMKKRDLVGAVDMVDSKVIGDRSVEIKYNQFHHSFNFRFTTAGHPATKESSETSFVTTLPAAIIQRLPMVTPGQTITPPAIQQSSPMVMGYPVSCGLRRSM